MQCPQCHHENPGDAKFCLECGRRLALSCGGCGIELPAGAKFCTECGQAVGAATSPTAARVEAPPESYTPKHLAEKILTSKAALEGERKQVTVLFADLKGSMELLADRDPEEARKLLDPVLEHMMEAVHRYEGTVNQVMGDGIMALFGAPVAHEDHAVRACYAALRMQESVTRYAEDVRRTEGIPIQIRVGLNSGEVVVRSIGSDLRMDYTAIGQTTHLAARMEQMATPGSILIPQETLNLAEGYVVVKPLGPMAVKGLETPIEAYEVTGASTVRSRLHAAAAKGFTRFVGRDSELKQLREALERARAAHGQVVAVVGEPGVGKSRLYWEFTRSHRTQGWLIVESGSVSYAKATAFLPIVDLLRTYFQVEAGDEARKIREKVTGKLLSLDRALEPSLAALLWLLDVPVDNPEWQRLDPPQRRQRALDGVRRLLLRESQVQPLLVLFEDLHWVDAETQGLLDSLVESLPTACLLLLVNYRPEYQHGWGGKTYYRQLRIDALLPGRAEELLEGLVGNDLTLQPLKRLLIERTEGNPFFLEESIRTLIETKALAGERGAYRLAPGSHNLQIPATVQAILAARIDRLRPEDKRLLQAAAAIGKDVPFSLLQGIAEETEEAVHRSLATLQAAEFLYEARLFPDLEYTFKHALTHDVTYGCLLQDRRRRLHGQIVATIEQLYPNRLAEHVERLTQHAVLGEVWDKAAGYARQAGTRAVDRSAYTQAGAYFDQALAALTHLPETRAVIEQSIDLRLDRLGPHWALGEREPRIRLLEEALPLAETLRDSHRLALVLSAMGNAFWSVGDNTRALAFAERAFEIASTSGDVSVRVLAASDLGMICRTLGAFRRARALLEGVVDILHGDLLHQRFGRSIIASVNARSVLAPCLAELGEFDQAATAGEEAVQIAETVQQPGSLIAASLGACSVLLRRGSFHQAVQRLEDLRPSRGASLAAWSSLSAGMLGYAYAMTGRPADALPLLEQAVEHAYRSNRTVEMILRTYLVEAYLLAGRHADAGASAARVLELSRQRAQRGVEARVLYLLGEIASHGEAPEVETAHTRYDQALALAGELGMRPLVAHCHLGLGKLYRSTGKREQAREHLATATTLYREMGMTHWLEQVEVEMRELAG